MEMDKASTLLGWVADYSGDGEIENRGPVEGQEVGRREGKQFRGLAKPQVSPCQVGI